MTAMTTTPELPVTIAGEHAGTLSAADGLVLTLRSPKAFPPGQPLQLSLQVEPPLPLEARTIGSRRLDPTSYELKVRLINVRRSTREALELVLRGD
jgi:hypothetical protein